MSTVSGVVTEQRVAAALMIFAFACFGTGATLPVIGRRGNVQIFTLPVEEHLLAVAENARRWRIANAFMGIGFVFLILGALIVTAPLERSQLVLARASQAGMLVAGVLWVAFSVFRATATVVAAREAAETGRTPAYYPALAAWLYELFRVYIVLGCLALAALGIALMGEGVVPSWVGWAVVVMMLATLAHLLISGDTLPAFHYFPGLLLGVVLL